MIQERQKREANKLFKELESKSANKKVELDKIKDKGEDTISAFMDMKEVPESFNDPVLNSGYHKLSLCNKKIDRLRSWSTQMILENKMSGIDYLRDLENAKLKIEEELGNINGN
ncbi:hypothetical protein C900_00965 [Fulvivirga imtechensis AK7]|uniref:Uncharacterized protein n=1 Tax=Fulvivirga imtechensis AK7 TaxID=1237149 RepID=L8JU99_9BACT|nr:hypothetical protein [Fulvivirga imtechensis]ELR72586.1 hypothetical protein C900_00965 [Fulvivirga imtechensis AK7]